MLLFYVSFLSKRYDGDALKQSGCIWSKPSAAGVNHPFAPLYFGAWWQLVKAFAPEDFVGRMSWLEALNSLLGAGAAGFAVAAIGRMGVSVFQSVLGGLILSFSHAWIYHSVQTTEPMMAQFWLMASIWVALRCQDSVPGAALSGVLWAISVGSYQSYILAGPAVLFLAVRRIKPAVAWVVCSGVVGFGLFTLAAVLNGAGNPGEVIVYLTTKTDGEYWGFLSLSQTVRVPLGFVQALAVPWSLEDWPGLALGFRKMSMLWRGIFTAQVVVTGAVALWAFVTPVREEHRRLRLILWVGLAAGLFPPLYLSPLYNKLWLFPLSFFVLLAVLAAARSRYGTYALGSMLALQLAANIPRVAIHGSDPQNQNLLAANALRASMTFEDLLVADSWDDSSTFFAMYPQQANLKLMFHHGGVSGLEKAIAAAHAAGHRVFVYGLLERSTERWLMSDLGTRPGLLRESDIVPFRQRAKLVWRGVDKGSSGDLYELPAVR